MSVEDPHKIIFSQMFGLVEPDFVDDQGELFLFPFLDSIPRCLAPPSEEARKGSRNANMDRKRESTDLPSTTSKLTEASLQSSFSEFTHLPSQENCDLVCIDTTMMTH